MTNFFSKKIRIFAKNFDFAYKNASFYTKKVMKKVLGLGNALTDVLIQVSEDDLRELGLPKGSMNLISMEQNEQIQFRFASFRKRLVAGGSASNAITTITQLGGKAAFIGKIGNDEIGDFYRDDLIKNGVKPLMLTSSDKMSGCCIVLMASAHLPHI